MSLAARVLLAAVAVGPAVIGCSGGAPDSRDDPLPAMCDWPEGKCALEGFPIEDTRSATEVSLSLSSYDASKACGAGVVVEVQIRREDPDSLGLQAHWRGVDGCDGSVLRVYVWRHVGGAWEEQPHLAFDVRGVMDAGGCGIMAFDADGTSRSAFNSLVDVRDTFKIRLAMFAANGCSAIPFEFHLTEPPPPFPCAVLFDRLQECGLDAAGGTCRASDDCANTCEAEASCERLDSARLDVKNECAELCAGGLGGAGGGP